MESILQHEITYSQTRASGLPSHVRGAQARCNATTISVLRDALQLQLYSEKKWTKTYKLLMETISHAKSKRPEGILDRGEEHHWLMNRMKPSMNQNRAHITGFPAPNTKMLLVIPQSKREVVDQAGGGMENPCLTSF